MMCGPATKMLDQGVFVTDIEWRGRLLRGVELQVFKKFIVRVVLLIDGFRKRG